MCFKIEWVRVLIAVECRKVGMKTETDRMAVNVFRTP